MTVLQNDQGNVYTFCGRVLDKMLLLILAQEALGGYVRSPSSGKLLVEIDNSLHLCSVRRCADDL